MPIENSLSFKGLQTSPNNLGAGSEGALVVADNVTIRYPDVLEPRRGQEGDAFGNTVGAEIRQVAFFDDKIVAHTLSNQIRVSDAAGPLTGTYAPADSANRLKTATSASTFYMATNKGVMALEQASDTVPRLSGIAEPQGAVPDIVADPTSPPPTIPGFLDPGKAVAYRMLFGYVDSHNAVHLGPPSVRTTIKNTTAGQATVRLRVQLYGVPTDANGDIVNGTFVRIYRSTMASTEALTSDELYLVSETVIDTSLYGPNDYIDIADTAEQDFAIQSAPLYTNPTQGGLPNDAPPYARDIANWDSRLWYANTQQPYSLTAQLIGVEGGGNPNIPATGIRVGDTVTIAGVVFTGATTNNPVSRLFRVWTTGPDAATNISQTLYWLSRVVNDYAAANPSTFKIRAYLEPVVFGDQLLNFKIRFQRPSVELAVNTAFNVKYQVLKNAVTVTGTLAPDIYEVQTTTQHNVLVDDWVELYNQDYYLGTFKVTNILSTTLFEIESPTSTVEDATDAFRAYGNSVWTPDLYDNPVYNQGNGAAADNERRDNGLYYSLPNEPEAVSAASYLVVGTAGRAIKRIVAQRDRLLVFKEEGTYAVYGDFPYQVSLIDDTVQILAPDSAIALGSTVFVLTDDGILAITDGGIQIVSRPIDSTLKPYLAANRRNFTSVQTFGVAYESEKVFALFMPSLGLLDYDAKAYVYGLESNAWTTWSFNAPRTCGRVNPFSDTAYYGSGSPPYLFKDRNSSSTADYVDGTTSVIYSTVQWAATTLGAPSQTKQARELHLHFRDARRQGLGSLNVDFNLKTDIQPSNADTIPVLSSDLTTYNPTIGGAVLPLQYRKLVPQNVQRATYYTLTMTAAVALGYWALNGYSIVFEGTSERTGTVR